MKMNWSRNSENQRLSAQSRLEYDDRRRMAVLERQADKILNERSSAKKAPKPKKKKSRKGRVPAKVVSPGANCPRCERAMDRCEHGEGWVPRSDQAYYFTYWDKCADCNFTQLYETAKVHIRPPAKPEAEVELPSVPLADSFHQIVVCRTKEDGIWSKWAWIRKAGAKMIACSDYIFDTMEDAWKDAPSILTEVDVAALSFAREHGL